MRFRTIRLYFKDGVLGLFKNKLMTLASVAVITACIFLLIVSYSAMLNVDYMLLQVEQTVGITVFPNEDLTEKRREMLSENLMNIPNVISVKYISPADALSSMEEDFGDEKGILESFRNDNPFSESFEIKISDVTKTKFVINEIKKLGDVRKIKEAEDLISLLTDVSNGLMIVGTIIIVVLGIISIVIIMNTIKLTVLVRSREINIMKYVGATDWFIRWPFIIEGVLIGVIGAIIPLGLGFLAYEKSIELALNVPLISSMFVFKDSIEVFMKLTPICLGSGAFIGLCGSISGIRKHLKV